MRRRRNDPAIQWDYNKAIWLGTCFLGGCAVWAFIAVVLWCYGADPLAQRVSRLGQEHGHEADAGGL